MFMSANRQPFEFPRLPAKVTLLSPSLSTFGCSRRPVGDAHASHPPSQRYGVAGSEAATELGSALMAHIKEQDAKIQRASDQLEMSKCAPKVASVK